MSGRRGFTLIEIMIVVVIIGILASLAVIRFSRASTKSKISEAKLMLKHIYEAAQEYYESHGAYPQPPWGIWFFNIATTKNTNWNTFPGLNVNRPSGYPRFTYLFWSWGGSFRACAWGWGPDSWDASVRRVNDLWITEDGIIYGGTLMD